MAENADFWHCHHRSPFSFWLDISKTIYIKVAWDQTSDEFKYGPSWPHLSCIYVPLIAENADFWTCHHRSPFSFDRILLKLICKVWLGIIISDEFENQPSWPIYHRVTSLWLLKMPIFLPCHHRSSPATSSWTKTNQTFPEMKQRWGSFDRIFLKLIFKVGWG